MTTPTIREICEEFRRLEKQLDLCDTSSPLSTAAVMQRMGDFTFNKAPALIAEIERLQRENEQVESMNLAISRDASEDRKRIIELMEQNAALVAEVERLQKENEKEPQPDSVCVESDGCPTENAVLKREWRRLQKRVEELEEDGKRLDFMDQVHPWVHNAASGYTESFGPKSPYWGMALRNEETLYGDTFREAIDAARAQKGEQ